MGIIELLVPSDLDGLYPNRSKLEKQVQQTHSNFNSTQGATRCV